MKYDIRNQKNQEKFINLMTIKSFERKSDYIHGIEHFSIEPLKERS